MRVSRAESHSLHARPAVRSGSLEIDFDLIVQFVDGVSSQHSTGVPRHRPLDGSPWFTSLLEGSGIGMLCVCLLVALALYRL